ncbi:cysteinyl leukotriene receptor 1-like [Mercenaria mercenaria]|uniref:cysteinyl leukotriene receptor 1-like n=1 Tax=Mercenaria mercenaria TaxID=6596 RepID=UPI00234F5DF0|nr:cysteinyl leukotriene receptor 1-like [Mercenaria mercenaria]
MNDLSNYVEYRLSVYLWKSLPPVLLLLGSAGNLLAILVLMRRKNRQSTSALYLTALAVSDLLMLWTGLLRQWIKYTFNIDVRDMSVFGCKVHVFLVYVALSCSSWFLVAFTFERFVAVWFPHKNKTVCSRKKAVISTIVISACLILLNSHWLYWVNLRPIYINNTTFQLRCDVIKVDFYQVFYRKWKWVDICVQSLIPLTLISVVNISIISRVVWRKYKRSTQIAPTSGAKERISQLTVMLVTTSTVFIMCTAPISVVIIVYNKRKSGQDLAIHLLWWAVVNLLAYLNNTINFMLYFLTGSKFRKQIRELFFSSCRSLNF